MIIGVPPPLETALLGWEISRRGLDRFGFQIPMHALVRAVVLRRGRPGKLHLDALLDPPNAQAGEPPEADGGERRAVIDPDHLGQPSLAHQALKSVQRAFELLIGLSPAT